jgi:hypothetical protein
MTASSSLTRGLLFALFCVLPTAASAQDAPKAGLVITSSSSVGILWHASERVALRPEIGYTQARVTNSEIDAESNQRNVAAGFSLLFYTGPREDVRFYWSPRYVYSRSSSNSSSFVGDSESVLTTHTVSLSVGAQYDAHERFGVFGELGGFLNRSTPGANANHNWGIRAVVGAIVTF